ncbi:MAG: multicopper oxidase domain-containing protein [Steroidobacteraceae bacterium]
MQCPPSTITHPAALNNNNAESAYTGPTQFGVASATPTTLTGTPSGNPTTNNTPGSTVAGVTGGYVTPTSNVNGAIKCQQVSGGDGYSTMADGTQTFMFAFGPLSGLAAIAAGHEGTQYPSGFNVVSPTTLVHGDPANTDGATSGASPGNGGAPTPSFTWNGAVGLAPDVAQTVTVANLLEGPFPATTPTTTAGTCSAAPGATTVTAWADAPTGFTAGQQILISAATAEGGTSTPPGYTGQVTLSCVSTTGGISPDGVLEYPFQWTAASGLAADTGNDIAAYAATPGVLDGHVDPRPIIDVGVMNGNIPGPLVAFDEDDELFLTLTNVGMIMRPDLFEQHTIHFHGYPNASSFYDGVPDASVAINIGASFTYYYLAPDAGTYFWHCHITPPEHLQMGMVGQLHVRPRQDRVPSGTSLFASLGLQNGLTCSATGTASTCTPLTSATPDLRTECNPGRDILCSATMPAVNTGATEGMDLLKNPQRYTYNDGDGSTAYDVEYPLQMHDFDPNFHFVGMTFNPELFVDMQSKYFLLNGRSYPDTIAPGPQASMTSDGQMHYSQPMPAIINIPFGGKALLRMVNLSVFEYHTLQSVGVPMKEVGFNAKLLRDQAGVNTEFYTNSITLGGGESLDVILDASDAGCGSANCAASLYPAGSVFYLYSPQLDHLSNDAENFGGMMTEVHICNSVTGGNTYGNTCN